MGRLPSWAHDHPMVWQTLYVLSIVVVVAMVLIALPLVRGDQPEWLQITLSTAAVSVVLALLFILPHRKH